MFKLLWAAIPLPGKLIGAGAVIALTLYGLGLYRTSLIQKGIDQGKLIVIEDNRKALEKAQAQARAAIEVERASIVAEKASAAKERHEIETRRATERAAYEQKLKAISAQQETDHADVCVIPADALDDAIRAELRANAARPPAQ